jgi:hypothetical protein
MLKLFTKKDKKYAIDEEIHRVVCDMASYSADSKEYTEMAKNLELLYKAKASEKRLSPDAVLSVVFGLVGTLTVLYFERANVITSKAFGSVFRGRG